MQVVHTAALPPNQGRMSRAISGCTRNSRNDERKIVAAWITRCPSGKADAARRQFPRPEARLSNAPGEVGRESGVACRREREEAPLCLRRNGQRSDELRKRAALEALPPRQI